MRTSDYAHLPFANLAWRLGTPQPDETSGYPGKRPAEASAKIDEPIGTISISPILPRVPEAIIQPPPSFPAAMERDGLSSYIVVDFAVGAGRKVLNAIVIASRPSGSNEAAIAHVPKGISSPAFVVAAK